MKDIASHPYYAVTVDGRVWSRPRKSPNPRNKAAFFQIGGRFLNPVTDSSGYKMVRLNSLGNKKLGKWFKVHRLVATAFIPNPDNKPFINHKNCVKDDNRVENLEWCTQKENVHHAIRMGRVKGQKGVGNGNSKLSELDVLLIRAMCELGEMKSEIAKWFGVERYFIHRIKNRQNWSHI